ncbi:hypothetical protein [Nocardiopsis ganjiahuensis]|uniref:hypothetical protein n=1 Tax=Nocardiopsis ganjiahuensis TaxID=239984 RepID=UPI001268DED2|nr:hypothetical protein [Nocardiopsis ganjiahuensis]
MSLKVNREPAARELPLPGSIFYKEDLKEIFSTLKRRSIDGEVGVVVSINGDEYEIDEIDDFDNPEITSQKFRSIRYRASHEGSSVVVDVSREAGKVVELRKDDDIVMTGVADKVLEIAQRREDNLRTFTLIILGSCTLMPVYLLSVRFLVGPTISLSELLGIPLTREILVEGELLGLIVAFLYIPVLIFALSKMRIKGNAIINHPKGRANLLREKLFKNWQASAFWAVVSATIGFLMGKFF